MSNTRYFNTNAGFYYQSSQGSTSYWGFPLAMPFLEVQPQWRVNKYVAESLDLSVRQTFVQMTTASSGAYELRVTIRYNNDVAGMARFLQGAFSEVGVIYTTAFSTETTGGGSSTGPFASSSAFNGSSAGTSMILIEPAGASITAALDRGRASFGDLEFSGLFRRTDGQAFTTTLY